MNQNQNNQTLFVGTDVSKETLDVSVLFDYTRHSHRQFSNDHKGFKQLQAWLETYPEFRFESALFCMEHTGLYTRQYVEFLLSQGARVWMESALHLKRSMGMTRGKNDKIDSLRIARYARTHQDQARLVSISGKSLQLIKDLVSARERIKKAYQSIKVSINEMQRVDPTTAKELSKTNKPALMGLLKSKEAVEKRILELIKQDPELNELFSLVTSVKGVGNVLATELIVYTHAFSRLTGTKQLACYCGVAPFSHTSGTSVNGRTGTSNFANMGLKANLHLAAMSSIRYVPELKSYYQRKVSEGKPKMSVLNAVRNKLLQRVLAVVKRGTPYQENYLAN